MKPEDKRNILARKQRAIEPMTTFDINAEQEEARGRVEELANMLASELSSTEQRVVRMNLRSELDRLDRLVEMEGGYAND